MLTADGFTALYDRHARALYRYCARRVGPDVAEDLVAQAFMIAYAQRHRYDPQQAESLPWLYGIVTRLLYRHRRDEVRWYRAVARTGTDPLLSGLTVDSHAHRADERTDAARQARRIAGALAGLPTRQREVLLLFAIGELSYAEISAVLDIPVGSVQSSLHRARTKLRTALTEGPGR